MVMQEKACLSDMNEHKGRGRGTTYERKMFPLKIPYKTLPNASGGVNEGRGWNFFIILDNKEKNGEDLAYSCRRVPMFF